MIGNAIQRVMFLWIALIPLHSVAQPVAPEPPQSIAPASPELLEWLRANAKPLDEPTCLQSLGQTPANLSPLLAVIGDAKLILLGEEQHGVSEFSNIKAHIIARMVRDAGVRVLLLEQGVADVAALDQWIAEPEVHTQPDPPLKGLYWCWATEEFASLARWLRAHNAALPAESRVRLIGFDVQSPSTALTAVEAFLRHSGSPMSDADIREVRPLADNPWTYHTVKEENRFMCSSVLANTINAVHARKPFDLPDWAFLPGRAADSAFAAERMFSTQDVAQAMNLRDEAMADSIGKLLDDPAFPRAVLWAHNAHISRSLNLGGFIPMGFHLADRFKDRTVTVGLFFERGSFRLDPRVSAQTGRAISAIEQPQPTTWGQTLANAPGAAWTCNFRSAPGNIREELIAPRSTSWGPDPLAKNYDAIVFVRNVTPIKPQ